MAAKNVNGDRGDPSPASDKFWVGSAKPGVPLGAANTSPKGGTAVLTFQAPASDGGTAITRYAPKQCSCTGLGRALAGQGDGQAPCGKHASRHPAAAHLFPQTAHRPLPKHHHLPCSYEVQSYLQAKANFTRAFQVADLFEAGVTEGTAARPFTVEFTGLAPGVWQFTVLAINTNGKGPATEKTAMLPVAGRLVLVGRTAVERCCTGVLLGAAALPRCGHSARTPSRNSWG